MSPKLVAVCCMASFVGGMVAFVAGAYLWLDNREFTAPWRRT